MFRFVRPGGIVGCEQALAGTERGEANERRNAPATLFTGRHVPHLAPGAGYAFLASTEWPGVEPPDVEHGDIEALVEAYPDFSEEIRAFTA